MKRRPLLNFRVSALYVLDENLVISYLTSHSQCYVSGDFQFILCILDKKSGPDNFLLYIVDKKPGMHVDWCSITASHHISEKYY
jgi:hypothetical protein